MDIQKLLKDPEACLEAMQRDGVSASFIDDARHRVDELQRLRQQVKEARDLKREVAARFKPARNAGEDLSPLRDEMSRVTARLKQLESRYSEAEKQLSDLLLEPEEEAPTLPAHLAEPVPPGDAPKGLRFEPLGDDNSAEWDAFVSAQSRATFYHGIGWRGIVEQTMRQQCLSLIAKDASDEVVGVLPLYRLKSRLFGDFGVSVPYVNYGGALGTNRAVEEALIGEASRRAEALGLDHLELRERERRHEMPCRDEKVSMVRQLPRSVEALDDELGAKLRSQIRRAQRAGPRFEWGADARQLEAFYAIFARKMRDLGTPVYGRELFEAIFAQWPGETFVVVGRLRERPIAGAFLIRHRDTLEIPWAATLPEADADSVNMAMYREVLGEAVSMGCRYFDFGRSTQDSGTYRFKRQWGAQPVPHYWHYWLPGGSELPELNPDSAKYRFLIRTWRRLPVGLTRLIGPGIVRCLP